MSVRIDDIIRKIYLDPFKITDEEINDAVKSPDSRRTLNLDEYEVNLFLKKTSEQYYLLVDARGGVPYNLGFAFRIFEHTLERVSLDNPLHVLQHFVLEFGHTLVIGDQYNRFIYEVKFAIPREEDQRNSLAHMVNAINILDLEDKEDHVKNAIAKFSRTSETEDLAEINFAYVINVPKYIRYLHENDPNAIKLLQYSD